MAPQDLGLPVDITWRRLAASADMMDATMDDATFPSRWKSSLAIFYADAPETDAYCDRTITYLKVTATITGYQIGEEELGYEFFPPSLEQTNNIAEVHHTIPFPINKRKLFGMLDIGQVEEVTVERTFKLDSGYRLASTVEEIQARLQIVNGSLTEAPRISTTPFSITVHLRGRPAVGPIGTDDRITMMQAELFYQVEYEQFPWGGQVIDSYRTTIGAYRPCHGAMLQVVVYPGKADGEISLEDYPYIVAFEPMKRELYEAVTDSGEALSASASNLNVRKGTTSTNRTENANVVTGVGASLEVGDVFSIGGSVSGEFGSRQRSQSENVNLVTTDASREKRETVSHSTSLSQLYTLLQSYHLATNRSLFLILPRPHQKQQFFTYANGLRELEGVQEFFFVVSRPKWVKGLCVSALLETAHVIDEERTRAVGQERYARLEPPITYVIDVPYIGRGWSPQTIPITLPQGYKLDRTRGEPEHLGVDLSYNWAGKTRYPPAVTIDTQDHVVTITITQYNENDEDDPSRVWGTAVVYGITESPTETPTEERWIESDVVLTGRRLNGCVASTNAKPPSNSGSMDGGEGMRRPAVPELLGLNDPISARGWLTYETTIRNTYDMMANDTLSARMRISNLQVREIERAMIESIGSPRRYKLGERRPADAQYIARELARTVARLPENHPTNISLEDIQKHFPGIVAERCQELGIHKLSDLALNLRLLENALRNSLLSQDLHALILEAAGLRPKAQNKST